MQFFRYHSLAINTSAVRLICGAKAICVRTATSASKFDTQAFVCALNTLTIAVYVLEIHPKHCKHSSMIRSEQLNWQAMQASRTEFHDVTICGSKNLNVITKSAVHLFFKCFPAKNETKNSLLVD
jgi:hypothetical protein